jgi:hypothetical protein
MIQELKELDIFILYYTEVVVGYRCPGRWSVNVEKRDLR